MVRRRYRILRLLGQGAVGAVYKAEDTDDGTLCAIKQALPGSGSSAVRALRHEADILAHISHARIPSTREFLSFWGRHFLIREYIEGRSLRLEIERGILPSEENVLDWSVQVAAILAYLHSRPVPVVVADLKPSNLLLDSEGKIYLVDLGLAGFYHYGSSDSNTGGTPGYAAPEQFVGHVGPRSDIFSLGATMFYLLTGRKQEQRHRGDTAASPLELRPELTPGTAAIISRALAYNIGERFLSISEMKSRLEGQQAILAALRE